MSIPILINTPSALASQVPNIKKAMDIAKAHGFAGVRMPIGVSDYPFSNSSNLNLIDTSVVTELIAYANSIGLGTVQMTFGYGPKISQLFANKFYGGRLWPNVTRPPLGNAATIGGIHYTSAWDYIGRVIWSQLWEAAWAARGAVTLASEWTNEPFAGGIGGYAAWSGTFTYLNGEYTKASNGKSYRSIQNGNKNHSPATSPTWWTLVADGTMDAGYDTYINTLRQLVNWHTGTKIAIALEGSGTSTAQTEVNQITGATWTAILAAADRIDTHRYADAFAGAVYNTAGMQAQYGTKLIAQINRMQANPVIGSKPIGLSEFGIRTDRTPRCTHPNKVRQDLVDKVKTEALAMGSLYTCFDTAIPKSASSDIFMYCFELAGTGLVYNGTALAVHG